MRHFLFFVCLFLNAKTFASSVDAIAGQIIAGKVAYCHATPQTDNLAHQNQFYGHIAEQHLGIGVDSYAHYHPHPPNGTIKLLRSEFELKVPISTTFTALRGFVPQGARCLWCLDILDAFIKPLIMPVKPKIAPIPKTIGSLLTIVTGLENAISTGKSLGEVDSMLQGMQGKILNIQNIITNLQFLKADITSYFSIINVLLNCGDNFLDKKGVDTGIHMASVIGDINTVLGAIDGYIATCQVIDNDNGTSATPSAPTSILTLTTLKTLNTIDLSRLNAILQLLSDHVLYVRGIFSSVQDEGMTVSKNLFQDALEKGNLVRNGPHADPSIDLFYQYNISGIVMKAELDATDPNSSWYDGTTQQLVDNRTITKNVKLGFSFYGTQLSYGTMFPVN